MVPEELGRILKQTLVGTDRGEKIREEFHLWIDRRQKYW